ncbi:MAG TPA: diguanylate cyclase, partial [Acidimicrobiales bacterium]
PVVVGEVARRLTSGLGSGEVLGASAADELAVLFATSPADEAAEALAGVLGDGQLELDLGPDRLVRIHVRAGLAASPDHATTGEELYMAADSALAAAGDAGEPVMTAP